MKALVIELAGMRPEREESADLYAVSHTNTVTTVSRFLGHRVPADERTVTRL